MDEWKFQQRRRKRGLHCLVHCVTADGVHHGKLCGCGGRTPPSKRKRARIIKRELARQARREG